MGAAIADARIETAQERSPAGATPTQDLEGVFTRYMDPIYRFIYSRVGNREDAEDLASQVFLKASQRLDDARSDASVASWLFTVARNVIVDHWRRYYRTPPSVELDETATLLHDEEPPTGSAEETEQLVERVLAALPPRYRQVLELRFLQGYSIDEIAQEMSVTPGNAKVLQHRALARAAQIGFPSREAEDAQVHRSWDARRIPVAHEAEGHDIHARTPEGSRV
jgi:RNA polymerase sigma-70 factor (ECF subfamily)